MRNLLKIIQHLKGVKYRFLFLGSYVYVEKGSVLVLGKGAKIRKAKIHLTNNSMVTIGEDVSIHNAKIACSGSTLEIGDRSIIDNGKMPVPCQIILSDKSVVKFGVCNRLKMERIWVRFSGLLTFGNYINLNEYSEVRCDEKITIGDFVEISYHVKIWDTNTHEFEPIEQRRERWQKLYIKRDVSEKPKTAPVEIGSDSWIGENVRIFKGTTIGQRCIVGFGTFISGKTIPDSTTVLNKIELKCLPNHL